MKKGIAYIASILLFALFFACSVNQRHNQSIDSIIGDSITSLFGQYNIVDSASIRINGKYCGAYYIRAKDKKRIDLEIVNR